MEQSKPRKSPQQLLDEKRQHTAKIAAKARQAELALKKAEIGHQKFLDGRTAGENEALGAVARLLLENDPGLLERFRKVGRESFDPKRQERLVRNLKAALGGLGEGDGDKTP